MVSRGAVAGGAVLAANGGVVKHSIGKIAGVAVAGRAGSRPMVCWRRMAARTILRADGVVVKDGIGKVCGVAVAG